MAGKLDLLNDEWIDIVFEDRNKEYGAYELRRRYSRNTALGIIFAIVFFTLGISAPLIIDLIKGLSTDDELLKVTEVTTLEAPPPIDKTVPPPPDVPPPPPLKSTVKFTPPVIKPDEEVKEDAPPPVDDLKEVDAGTETVEGDSSGVDMSLVESELIGEETDEVVLVAEEQPTFPGGEEKLYKYLQENIKYPAMAREANITGRVYVSFVVGKDGKIRDAKVLRGIGGGCDQEAIRVINSMPPWKPGKMSGHPVSVSYNLPINFSLK
jgi:periplasmic protein TonB